jgi:UV DNA damage endonuclease
LKIGYPTTNLSIGCRANSTFRLASYSEERLASTVEGNLTCMERILEYNVRKRLLFFRISSDLVPFASHPVCRFDWASHFEEHFGRIGRFIRENGLRISMHPDQFIVLSSPDPEIVRRSLGELAYHCRVLDLLGLDATAKVQIHLGGAYGNKGEALKRFARTYRRAGDLLTGRLAVENDHRVYGLEDCLAVHGETSVPVVFDVFHHRLLNRGEPLREALSRACGTWSGRDGVPMVDYSSQEPGARRGTHASTVDIGDFSRFLEEVSGYDVDLLLEIKDKEKSALKCLKAVESARVRKPVLSPSRRSSIRSPSRAR